MRRSVTVGGAGMIALFWSATAQAMPTARLIYGRGTGSESCPEESVVRRAVASRVGYDPFFPYASRTVILTIGGRDTKLAARIELVENGQATARELSTDRGACDELIESAALAIAIAIDLRALIAPSPETPAPDPRPTSPPPAPAPRTPPADALPAKAVEEAGTAEAPRGARPASNAPRWRVGLGPRLSSGFQPGAAAGLGGDVAAVWARVSLGVEVESYLPTEATASSGARVRGWLVDGALVPCVRLPPIHVCGVARAGRFEGAGSHVLDPTTDASLFLAVGGRAGVELPLSEAARVHLDGDIVGDVIRPALDVGREAIWRAPAAAAVLAIATSYRF